MESLYIVIPAYNEEENIEKVIEQWYPVVKKYNGNNESRLVIFDDGSKDNTYSIARRKITDFPLLEVITKENGGHGATVLAGYKYALEKGADYIFQTDSDGQTLPDEFEEFWKNRNKNDLVIGKRIHRKDGISRIIVTKVLKLVIKVCFKVSVEDANTPYRLMNTECLKKYIEFIPDGFNLSNVLLTVIYRKAGCTIKYIPITFLERQGGVNSINLKKICKIGIQAIKDFMMINKTISYDGGIL